MVFGMLFKLNKKEFTVYNEGGINYLYADTTMFGSKLRLGDFVMYSTLLFCLKQWLINDTDNDFTQDNFYFKLNRIGGLMIDNILSTLSLFPNVWRGFDVRKDGGCNVRQCCGGGNIWSFKMYLEERGIKLSDKQFNNQHVIDPSAFNLTGNKRNTIYIFPVRAKEYNTERNMSDRDLVKIIKKIDRRERIVVITKDSNINIQRLRSECNRSLDRLDDSWTWLEIILEMMTNCSLYISGDCGLSHLVSMIHKDYKPMMELYYRTNDFIMSKPHNSYDESVSVINFIPYKPYLTDNMLIHKIF
jgi:hypothetical protein